MTWVKTYARGAELDALVLPWQVKQANGSYQDRDLSAGWSFTFTLTAEKGGAVVLTKAGGSGVFGLTTGVRVEWAANDLDITPGLYVVGLVATTGGLDLYYGDPKNPPRIEIV